MKTRLIEKLSLIDVDPTEIDEVEIYFINDDGSFVTPEREIIPEREYKNKLEEERKAGERIIEVTS